MSNEEWCSACDEPVSDCWCDERCGDCNEHQDDCTCIICDKCGEPVSDCWCDERCGDCNEHQDDCACEGQLCRICGERIEGGVCSYVTRCLAIVAENRAPLSMSAAKDILAKHQISQTDRVLMAAVISKDRDIRQVETIDDVKEKLMRELTERRIEDGEIPENIEEPTPQAEGATPA